MRFLFHIDIALTLDTAAIEMITQYVQMLEIGEGAWNLGGHVILCVGMTT